MKRKVEVTLLGKRFTVRSEKDEAYVHALANFVTRRFEEVQRSARTLSSHDLALLVALNIADDLFAAEDRANATREEVQTRTERLMDHLKAALGPEDVEAATADEVPLLEAAEVATAEVANANAKA